MTLMDMEEIKTLPFEVSSGTTLDLGSTVLDGSGLVLVRDGAVIETALAGGIEELLAEVTGTDSLETGSGFGFNGTEAQVTSSRMPLEVGDLVIDNEAGVTLSQETTINGVLHLVAGVFDNTIAFTLGAEGSISYEGGSLLIPVTAIESDVLPIPVKFFVDQNYPNPFNPNTTIHFGLPATTHVKAQVFNLLGQQVTTLYDGLLKAGEHELQFEAGNLTSGVYFYRIQAGNDVLMKQMVLLK